MRNRTGEYITACALTGRRNLRVANSPSPDLERLPAIPLPVISATICGDSHKPVPAVADAAPVPESAATVLPYNLPL